MKTTIAVRSSIPPLSHGLHRSVAAIEKYLCIFLLIASCVESLSRADQPVFTALPPYGGSQRAGLVVSGNQLYVAFLIPPWDIADSPLAQWDGNAWSSLGGAGLRRVGQELSVSSIAGTSSNLFVAGQFITPDGSATNLAVWDGTQWSGLGSGLDDAYVGSPAISAMALIGKDLYVGGYFTAAGGQPITNIAKWNGKSWLPLGAGVLPGGVHCMAVSGNNLYVGGHGANMPSITKWDGTNWSNLGSGLGADVFGIATSGDNVYAAGDFGSGIAKWDGTNWSPLGSGLTFRSGCLSCTAGGLAIVGKDVYVSGSFIAAGGVPANGFAKWDGAQWTGIDLGASNSLGGPVVVGTNLLYVSGSTFDSLDSSYHEYILRADLSPLPPPSLTIDMSDSNTAMITWPAAANGTLQQAAELNSTNWVVPAGTVNSNGVNKSILINLSGGNAFFRLTKP
jgi:hypothetical protein